MKTCPAADLLNRLLDENLSSRERAEVETHVEHCAHCQQMLERLTEDSLLGPKAQADTITFCQDGSTTQGPVQPASNTPRSPAETWPSRPPPVSESATPSTSPLPDELAFLARSPLPGSLGRIDHYEILEVLGRGGMGLVFRALDSKLQRPVALKVMALELAASAEARQRFVREARTAATVTHENVVTIHAVEEAHRPPYLVMQLVQGESLQARLDRDGPLPVPDIIELGKQLARGLAAAHAQGLIHRDIKPANILLAHPVSREPKATGWQTATVKLTDFGLARAVDDLGLTRSGVIAGTPVYMSPEQAEGHRLDQRSDLFSLGSVLYALCTGQPPFRAENSLAVLKRICEATPAPLRAVNPAVPPWLEALTLRLLAKDPDQRFQNATEVVAALTVEMAEVPQDGVITAAPSPPRTIPAPEPRKQRWRWLVAGVLTALVMGGGTALWLQFRMFGHLPQPRWERLPPPGPLPSRFTNRFGMEFVLVPRGRSWLSGGGGKTGSNRVDIPYDFYLGQYEVTQQQWEAVTGSNPSHFARNGSGSDVVQTISDEELMRFPVERVSWSQVGTFLAALNQEDEEPGWKYCAPLTEEWEYACRGGPLQDQLVSAFDFYLEQPTLELLPEQANFGHSAGLKRTCAIGSYRPNGLGLHDMHGNVSEWCDADEPSPHGRLGPVLRGGAWPLKADSARASAYQVIPPPTQNNFLGVRVARVFVGKKE